MAEQAPDAPEPQSGESVPFPSYEEICQDLVDALDRSGLTVEDARHHHEPTLGERRFECTVRLAPVDPPSRYHVHLSFAWDALLTYISAYGPGADCELYHDDDEAQDCPHRQLQPQPYVEVEAEFVLGDGGYELQDVNEISGWVETVQALLNKAFHSEDKPSVHVGLAALGATQLVEKFTAEHSWIIDFENGPDFDRIGEEVRDALRLIPQLADRLPI